MTTQHTPGPWRIEPPEPTHFHYRIFGRRNPERGGENAHFVAHVSGDADAAFIVRAVNSHHDLLAALEAATAWLEDLVCEKAINGDSAAQAIWEDGVFTADLDAARAAIAAAKGETL
jgi:hypothetical protein